MLIFRTIFNTKNIICLWTPDFNRVRNKCAIFFFSRQFSMWLKCAIVSEHAIWLIDSNVRLEWKMYTQKFSAHSDTHTRGKKKLNRLYLTYKSSQSKKPKICEFYREKKQQSKTWTLRMKLSVEKSATYWWIIHVLHGEKRRFHWIANMKEASMPFIATRHTGSFHLHSDWCNFTKSIATLFASKWVVLAGFFSPFFSTIEW